MSGKITQGSTTKEHGGQRPSSARLTAVAQPLTRLGHYRIVRELGRGGMGIVYRATQQATGRPVALELLLAARDPILRARWQREAAALVDGGSLRSSWARRATSPPTSTGTPRCSSAPARGSGNGRVSEHVRPFDTTGRRERHAARRS